MRSPSLIAIISAALAASVKAQGPVSVKPQSIVTNEIPPVEGAPTPTPGVAASTSAAASAAASAVSSSMSSMSSVASAVTSISTSTSAYPTSTSSYSYAAGSVLSNGGYVCNPAHYYGSGYSCDSSGATPTLVSAPVGSTSAAMMTASTTTANGSVIAYTGYSPTGPYIGVWTGAAVANAVPVAGALLIGAVGLVV